MARLHASVLGEVNVPGTCKRFRLQDTSNVRGQLGSNSLHVDGRFFLVAGTFFLIPPFKEFELAFMMRSVIYL